MVSTLYQYVLKTQFLSKQVQISCSSDHTILFKFHQLVVQIFWKERMERL